MAFTKKEIITLIWLCILATAVTATVTTFLYSSRYDTTIIPFDLVISDYVGINADTDILHFGTGYPGSTLERTLQFHNSQETVAEIRITSTVDFVHPEISTFTLRPTENRTLTIYASLPSEARQKTYTGKILIYQREEKP